MTVYEIKVPLCQAGDTEVNMHDQVEFSIASHIIHVACCIILKLVQMNLHNDYITD